MHFYAIGDSRGNRNKHEVETACNENKFGINDKHFSLTKLRSQLKEFKSSLPSLCHHINNKPPSVCHPNHINNKPYGEEIKHNKIDEEIRHYKNEDTRHNKIDEEKRHNESDEEIRHNKIEEEMLHNKIDEEMFIATEFESVLSDFITQQRQHQQEQIKQIMSSVEIKIQDDFLKKKNNRNCEESTSISTSRDRTSVCAYLESEEEIVPMCKICLCVDRLEFYDLNRHYNLLQTDKCAVAIKLDFFDAKHNRICCSEGASEWHAFETMDGEQEKTKQRYASSNSNVKQVIMKDNISFDVEESVMKLSSLMVGHVQASVYNPMQRKVEQKGYQKWEVSLKNTANSNLNLNLNANKLKLCKNNCIVGALYIHVQSIQSADFCKPLRIKNVAKKAQRLLDILHKTPQMYVSNITSKQWHFQDDNKEIHGPFKTEPILRWAEGGWFRHSTKLRQSGFAKYHSLNEMLDQTRDLLIDAYEHYIEECNILDTENLKKKKKLCDAWGETPVVNIAEVHDKLTDIRTQLGVEKSTNAKRKNLGEKEIRFFPRQNQNVDISVQPYHCFNHNVSHTDKQAYQCLNKNVLYADRQPFHCFNKNVSYTALLRQRQTGNSNL